MRSVKINGLEELKKSLGRKKMSIEQINKAVEAAVNAGYEDAVANCPKKTGKLAGSIEKHIEGTTGIVKTDLEYAPYVEFGTKKHGAAQPFMRPAQKKARETLFEVALRLVKNK